MLSYPLDRLLSFDTLSQQPNEQVLCPVGLLRLSLRVSRRWSMREPWRTSAIVVVSSWRLSQRAFVVPLPIASLVVLAASLRSIVQASGAALFLIAVLSWTVIHHLVHRSPALENLLPQSFMADRENHLGKVHEGHPGSVCSCVPGEDEPSCSNIASEA